MIPKRSFCLALGLFVLLAVAAIAMAGADGGGSIARAGQLASNLEAPLITPTPYLPDYVPYIAWDPAYPCPYPVLQVGSRNQGNFVCWTLDIRLENSSGEHRDFTAHNEAFGLVTYPCQIGDCVPYSWLDSMPFTVTVDYNNALPELDENNNTVVFTTQPPQPPNCGLSTGTPTPTRMPSITPTVTHTPAFPDLVGTPQWIVVPDCPGFALELRTQINGDNCAYAGPSHTRLQNSRGETIEFAVHGLQAPYRIYDYDCPIGNCLPDSWLTAMPFTMTVDVNNEVWESNGEGNNVSVFNIAPPPNPCGTSTPSYTPTPTISPTFTYSPTPTIPPTLTHSPTPTLSPTTTPTPACPDFTGDLQWVGVCPAPVLRLTTHLSYPLSTPVSATTMRLRNNNGDYIDFPVPAFPSGSGTYYHDCELGSCIPSSWASALPLTLTVDVLNEVSECNENNNTFTLIYPPPAPTPCGITPTFTYTPVTGTPTTTPCTMNFSDVHVSDYFYEDVRGLYCLGAISGYADGTFRPFNNTTRGQICKIVVLAFRFPIDTHGGPHFSDVQQGSPFYDYIETAYNRGIISGYADGTFRPGNPVTRGQLVKIICRALGWPLLDPAYPAFSDVPQGSAFYQYVETAVCQGVISGYADGTFRPGNNATRSQVCKIVLHAVRYPAPCNTPTPQPTIPPRPSPPTLAVP